MSETSTTVGDTFTSFKKCSPSLDCYSYNLNHITTLHNRDITTRDIQLKNSSATYRIHPIAALIHTMEYLIAALKKYSRIGY